MTTRNEDLGAPNTQVLDSDEFTPGGWPEPCPFDRYARSGLCVRCEHEFLGVAA